MGVRATLPKLSLKFPTAPTGTKPSTSPVPSPPSAGTPPSSSSSKTSTPHAMTPPARLHMRSILPASPECLPTPPPPPPRPRPFIWQCHSCLSIWRLATTRRCLNCTHEYCTSTQRPTIGRRRRRRRNGPGSGGSYCAAEFDYKGWEEWGNWRRKVLGAGAPTPTQEARERAFFNATHDCWRDCDYPSQCHHERVEIAARVAAAGSNGNSWWRLQTVAEEPEVSPPIVEHSTTSPDDDLVMNEALDIAQEVEADELTSPTSPKSPLGQSTFFPDSLPAPPSTTKPKEKEPWWRPATEEESRAFRARGNKNAKGMSPVALGRLLKEDRNMMPLQLSTYENSRSSGGKLTVRNVADDEEEEEEKGQTSSSSDDDDESVSDDSSDDEEYEMPESALNSFVDPRTPEEIEKDLQRLLEASRSFWRE